MAWVLCLQYVLQVRRPSYGSPMGDFWFTVIFASGWFWIVCTVVGLW